MVGLSTMSLSIVKAHPNPHLLPLGLYMLFWMNVSEQEVRVYADDVVLPQVPNNLCTFSGNFLCVLLLAVAGVRLLSGLSVAHINLET